MKFNKLKKMMLGGTLVLALLFQSVLIAPVYADEEVNAEGAEGEAAAEGGEVPEGAEGEPAEDGGEASGAPAVGTIVTNNGMYIANTFPDEYMPAGFRKMTVAYQDQNVELASMDASNGTVTLAYLTDATGSHGDFYLCDTTTAEMSDFVMFDGGNDRFIVVLDPGSEEAPEGFELTALSVNGKSVKAWIYTGEASDDKEKKKKDKDKDKDKDKEEEASSDGSEDEEKDKGLLGGLFGSLKPVRAYAGELDLGIGSGAAGSGGDAGAAVGSDGAGEAPVPDSAGDGAEDQENAAASDEGAYDVSAPAATGGEPDPSEYFLVYAMDQSGYKGFFLYDSVGQTYLRYVDLGAGNAAKLEKASKSAKIRLFIIIALLVLLIVLVIILVNMALSGKRNDDYYDDDDDYEEMKRRVEKKSKRAPRLSRNDYDDYDDDDDYDDYDEDDDVEDVKVYNRKPDRRRLAPAQPQHQPVRQAPGQLGARRKAPSQDIDLDDDFSFDFIKK